MPTRCVAAGCSSTYSDDGISLFQFPKDLVVKVLLIIHFAPKSAAFKEWITGTGG